MIKKVFFGAQFNGQKRKVNNVLKSERNENQFYQLGQFRKK